MDTRSKTELRQQRFRENYPNEARKLSSPEARAELKEVATGIDRIVTNVQISCASEYDAYNLLINI